MNSQVLLLRENDHESKYSSPNQLIHTNFLKMVEKFPNAIALMIGIQEWTYSDVKRISSKWASVVINNSERQLKRIGILGYRSEVSYLGILTSLFTGAAFVPLNPNFPLERTSKMAELASLDAIIVGEESVDYFHQLAKLNDTIAPLVLFPNTSIDTGKFKMNVLDQQDVHLSNYKLEEVECSEKSIAYLLFTSGSTGEPKGVAINHTNVVHYLEINQQKYQITPQDRLTQTFDQTFDLAIFDMFMAWSNGATVCAMQPIELLSPIRFIEEKKVTVWFSVPSLVTLLRKQKLLKEGALASLRLSLFCGEPLHKSTVDAWQVAAPNSVIENLYGPTELTISCSSYRWTKGTSENECLNQIVPIGKINSGLDFLIIDEKQQPVKEGEIGELCVSGPQNSPGYWCNYQLVESDTFKYTNAKGEEVSYYRTGDQVVMLPTGNIAYIGRLDKQVKIKGYRVDCGEIEGLISEQNGVLSVAVVPRLVKEGEVNGLVAYIVGENINSESIFQSLRVKLPSYMIPESIRIIEKMPLNVNGKIDRNKLQKITKGSI
ncbi:AMP-binding protein [Rossellomorea vietnamensis]|uniref:Amino acid adenylation domain-containing protein n=1 Tax=Rossellomorea vietnamensis TaxID=218284 RepID=A0A0N8GG67_9BACI|nr:AMP-binding protein [Rossellomorea vietnamensis]KPL57650.1 hypothetical protein AM506_21040 [Rossellomorea vietnamensis]